MGVTHTLPRFSQRPRIGYRLHFGASRARTCRNAGLALNPQPPEGLGGESRRTGTGLAPPRGVTRPASFYEREINRHFVTHTRTIVGTIATSGLKHFLPFQSHHKLCDVIRSAINYGFGIPPQKRYHSLRQ
jgi:hypothetical protein